MTPKVIPIIIIIIISGFGIYGAAVVPDSGVGNTWQRLTLVLHEFLSNGLTPVTDTLYADKFISMPLNIGQKPLGY